MRRTFKEGETVKVEWIAIKEHDRTYVLYKSDERYEFGRRTYRAPPQ